MSGAVPSAPLVLDAVAPPNAVRQAGGAAELFWVGGFSALLFPLSWWLRGALGLDEAELAVGFVTFYAAHLINDPHFAVTYLLFYRDARARALGATFPRRLRMDYRLAGFVAPAGLLAWIVLAFWLRSAPALGALNQLMVLLVGWHYTKQGFGVLSVLSARRGLRFTPGERRALLAHCYAAWAYAWASPFDPGREVEQKGLVYTTFAHPVWLEPLTLTFLLCTIPGLAVLAWRAVRTQRLRQLAGPLATFLSTVWIWVVFSSVDPLLRYVIPALHCLQYLYFVWLLQGNEALEQEQAPYFGPSIGYRLAMLALSAVGLGWLLFHGLPGVLDGSLVSRDMARSSFGATPYFSALYAFVNIHHFLMDAVLWRRDNPAMRYLQRTPGVQSVETGDATARPVLVAEVAQ